MLVYFWFQKVAHPPPPFKIFDEFYLYKVMVKEDILKQHLETIHDKTMGDNLAAGSSLNPGV